MRRFASQLEMIHVKTRAEASISPAEIAAMIKTKTYELGSQSGTRKRTPEPQHPIDIAEPEPKQSLVEDIARCEVLRRPQTANKSY